MVRASECAAESCDALLAATLDAALAELGRAYGPDMAQWQWRRAHTAEFASPVLGRIAVLRGWVDVGVPTAGGFDTINRGSTTTRDDAHPYRSSSALGCASSPILPPGRIADDRDPRQSGNPLSPHFSDLLPRWRDFDYLVPGRATAVATLKLEPAK